MCGISIKCDGEWVTKWDGSGNTDFEAVKGGFSGSMKRAAVQWGIGRYLYNIEATFAVINENGKHYQKGRKDYYKSFKWDAPQMPDWALPKLELEDVENGLAICDDSESIDRYAKALFEKFPRMTEKQKTEIREVFNLKRQSIRSEGKNNENNK